MYVITKNFSHTDTCYLTEIMVKGSMYYIKYGLQLNKAITFKDEQEALQFAIGNRLKDYKVIPLDMDVEETPLDEELPEQLTYLTKHLY